VFSLGSVPWLYISDNKTSGGNIKLQQFYKNVKIKIYQLITLGLFSFRGVNLGSRDEHTLRVFESRVLGRIVGSMKEELIIGCRKL
jgi:hypothetical protein